MACHVVILRETSMEIFNHIIGYLSQITDKIRLLQSDEARLVTHLCLLHRHYNADMLSEKGFSGKAIF